MPKISENCLRNAYAYEKCNALYAPVELILNKLVYNTYNLQLIDRLFTSFIFSLPYVYILLSHHPQQPLSVFRLPPLTGFTKSLNLEEISYRDKSARCLKYTPKMCAFPGERCWVAYTQFSQMLGLS